MQTYNDL